MRPGLRFRILARDNYTCQYCGLRAPAVELHVDHVVPQSKGGTNDPSNLLTACAPCNQGKRDVLLESTGPELTPDEAADALEVLREEALDWLQYGLIGLGMDWETFTGRLISTREQLFLGKLFIRYGVRSMSRAMRRVAERRGFEEGEPCEHAFDRVVHTDECSTFVELDLFEIRQTLERWRHDGFV